MITNLTNQAGEIWEMYWSSQRYNIREIGRVALCIYQNGVITKKKRGKVALSIDHNNVKTEAEVKNLQWLLIIFKLQHHQSGRVAECNDHHKVLTWAKMEKMR